MSTCGLLGVSLLGGPHTLLRQDSVVIGRACSWGVQRRSIQTRILQPSGGQPMHTTVGVGSCQEYAAKALAKRQRRGCAHQVTVIDELLCIPEANFIWHS